MEDTTKEALRELGTRLPDVVTVLRSISTGDLSIDGQLYVLTDELAQLAQIAVSTCDAEETTTDHSFEGVSERYRRQIPEAILEGLNNWVVHGQWPGSFLTAVLEGDLFRAAGTADPDSVRALPTIVRYIHSRLPAGCFGSRAAMSAWEGVEERYLDDRLVWPAGGAR